MGKHYWIVIGGIGIAAIAFAALAPDWLRPTIGLPWNYEHLLGYFFVTAVIGSACRSAGRTALIGVGMTMLAAIFEVAQYFLPSRSFYAPAILWSAAGVWSGVIFSVVFRRLVLR